MKTLKLGKTNLEVPVIGLGCMRLAGAEKKQAEEFFATALEQGLNFFDHADIYGRGKCEEVFAELMKGTDREKLILQSKCGIVPGKMFDFSKEHILSSVDGILQRLDLEYLDVLLLHRPDALMEPEEVAEAFDRLEESGKVRYFGVSNQKPMQMELLKKCVKQELVANQLQLSIPVSNMIANGIEVNMDSAGSVDRDGSVLDYCRLHDITIQAWSPFQMSNWRGVFLGSPEYPELNKALDELSEKYHSTPTALAAAWILRHPAKMQVIAGTASEERLSEIAAAAQVELSREDWYRLYLSAGHILP